MAKLGDQYREELPGVDTVKVGYFKEEEIGSSTTGYLHAALTVAPSGGTEISEVVAVNVHTMPAPIAASILAAIKQAYLIGRAQV